MAEIRFLTNEADKTEGLAYAGFETFRGSPYTSCARETGQNSRDAVGGEGPVRVRFALHRLERSRVPFADKLAHSIGCCLAAPQDEKTKHHLERALAAIAAPVISVLEISDRNTTGLTGPVSDPASVFNALVKGDGVTNKADDTSAGSFGIGKNAAYAVSDLQTVIYSTCWRDAGSDETHFAAQGRLRLISHVDGEARFSAEGYWGNPGFAAIEDRADVPDWMGRSEVGTSIFSVGFREEGDWASRMTLSLVTNFFLAIERSEIEFEVGDSVRINRASLDSIVDSVELRKTAEEADQSEDLARARRLLDCVRSEAAVHRPVAVPGLGDFTFHLLVGERLPREVHILRNGIYITDNFAKFSQPMRRFPGTREFTAVLEPARGPGGRGPSALLKQLENPAHDAFEPERLVDMAEREKARSQIRQLINKIRAIIRAEAKLGDRSRSQLDELSELFADPLSATEGREDSEKDPDRFRYGAARRGRRDRNSGTDGSGKGRRRGGKAGKKPGPRTGTGKKSRRAAGVETAIPLDAVRSVIPDAEDHRGRTLFFTPAGDGPIELIVAASGLSGDVELAVNGSSPGMARKGRARATVRAGERVRLDVTLAEPFAGPIELTALALRMPEPETAR